MPKAFLMPTASTRWRAPLLFGFVFSLASSCGGKVDGVDGSGGSGGSAGSAATFSCTVNEVDFGYSWCIRASVDAACHGAKGTTCAENFVARCTYADVVIHYYGIDEAQTADVRGKCIAAGATFSQP